MKTFLSTLEACRPGHLALGAAGLAASPSRWATTAMASRTTPRWTGYRTDALIHSTMFFVVVLFVIMCIWMVAACVQFGPKHEALYEHGNGFKQIMTSPPSCRPSIFFIVDGNLFSSR